MFVVISNHEQSPDAKASGLFCIGYKIKNFILLLFAAICLRA